MINDRIAFEILAKQLFDDHLKITDISSSWSNISNLSRDKWRLHARDLLIEQKDGFPDIKKGL